MSRIFVVRTRDDGRAEIGTALINVDKLQLEALGPVDKAFGDDANPHHPKDGEPILLGIDDGSHTIIAAGDGRVEQYVTLEKGDLILFVDFKPDIVVTEGATFTYAGHQSAPGSNGAKLNPSKVLSEVPSLDSWEPLSA